MKRANYYPTTEITKSTFKTFLILFFSLSFQSLFAQQLDNLADQVLIRRTEYGVPHIKADNLKAVAFGLAWCELEDYGERVIKPLISARGDLAKVEGVGFCWILHKKSCYSYNDRALL